MLDYTADLEIRHPPSKILDSILKIDIKRDVSSKGASKLEPSKVENDYARLVSGEVLKSKIPKLQIEKENNIERLVDCYSGNTWEHMSGVSRNFLDLKKAN
ncbi:unnamed protein product [Brachionus calyciflorus]|uniref:Uncharacterized protein n=2 Tax=Brachionus calyciflorus TaxID=104777 RepID=A0A814JF78_9BILA|nr:unnamed protein product [Brachionus calyciflorus]